MWVIVENLNGDLKIVGPFFNANQAYEQAERTGYGVEEVTIHKICESKGEDEIADGPILYKKLNEFKQ